MATVKGCLGQGSNNVAEYHGLRASMRRAVRIAIAQPERAASAHRVVFQVDSKLIAGHLARRTPSRCRAPTLRALFAECRTAGLELSRVGVSWTVEHVYREYNATADTLANEGVDLRLAGRVKASVGW